MVNASINTLGLMNIDINDFMEMPELEEEDAKCFFLHFIFDHHFMTKDEPKIEHFERQCEFQQVVNMG